MKSKLEEDQDQDQEYKEEDQVEEKDQGKIELTGSKNFQNKGGPKSDNLLMKDEINEIQNPIKLTEDTKNYNNINQKLTGLLFPPIKINVTLYRIAFLLFLMIITIGAILQITKPLTYNDVSGKTGLTGLPILNAYYLHILELLFMFYNLIITLKHICTSFKSFLVNAKSCKIVFYFLNSVNCLFFFSNLVYFCLFILIHQLIFDPLCVKTGFKISGHLYEALIFSAVSVNFHMVYMHFISMKIDKVINYIALGINGLLFLHTLYTILWTSWVFHSILEMFSSFLISALVVFITRNIKIDYFCLMFFRTICVGDNKKIQNKKLNK